MRPGTLLVALASVVIVSACSPTGALTPTSAPETPPRTTSISQSPTITETSTPTPTPTPSPSVFESFPPPPADETPEQAAIRQGWMNYWHTLDRYLKDQTLSDLTELTLITVDGSPKASSVLAQVSRYRKSNWLLKGDRTFREVVIKELSNETGIPTASVAYCHDGSLLSLRDSVSGDPVIVESIATAREQATLEREDDGVWRVSSIANEVASC